MPEGKKSETSRKKKDIISFIDEEVRKTGFVTEVEVIDTLELEGWDYVAPHSYIDYDEDKWRQIDMVGFRCLPEVEGAATKGGVCIDIVIECKKSKEFAWVFYVPKRTADWRRLFHIDCFDLIGIAKQLSLMSQRVGIKATRRSYPWVSYDMIGDPKPPLIPIDKVSELRDFRELGVFRDQGFRYFIESKLGLYGKEIKISKRKKSRSSPLPEIFEALVEVNKAVTYLMQLDAHAPYMCLKEWANSRTGKLVAGLEVLIPVIVLDGPLYSWEQDEGIQEQKQILARMEYKSHRYDWRRVVPIVRLDYFRCFLASLNKDIENLYQEMLNRKLDIDEQSKLLMKGLR